MATPMVLIINNTKELLISTFEIKELGKVKRFLSFNVVKDRKNRTIFLNQKAYTRAIIKKYGYKDLNETNTP